MSLGELFGLGHKGNRHMVLDIGSGSVGACMVDFQIKPEVFMPMRHEYRIEEFPDFEKFFSQILSGIEEVGGSLIKDKDYRRPKRIFCFLPSVVYFSEIRNITYREKSNFKVDAEHINRIVDEERAKFSKEAHFENFEISNNEPYILEEKIMSVKLNGYDINKPLGKKTKELSLSLYLSYTPKEIVEAIRHIISTNFNSKIEFHSHIFALFDVVRETVGIESNFVLLNITGDVTDILVAHRGELEALASFPFGVRTLIRKIAQSAGTSIDDARSSLRLFSDNDMNNASKLEMLAYFNEVKVEWKKSIIYAIQRAELDGRIPNRCFLVGDGSAMKVFKDWLSTEKNEIFRVNNDIDIQFVHGGMLDHLVRTDGKNKVDMHLAALSLFTKKLV